MYFPLQGKEDELEEIAEILLEVPLHAVVNRANKMKIDDLKTLIMVYSPSMTLDPSVA
jgi:hypothetical protein